MGPANTYRAGPPTGSQTQQAAKQGRHQFIPINQRARGQGQAYSFLASCAQFSLQPLIAFTKKNTHPRKPDRNAPETARLHHKVERGPGVREAKPPATRPTSPTTFGTQKRHPRPATLRHSPHTRHSLRGIVPHLSGPPPAHVMPHAQQEDQPQSTPSSPAPASRSPTAATCPRRRPSSPRSATTRSASTPASPSSTRPKEADEQVVEYEEQYAATATLAQTLRAFKAVYIPHLEMARLKFKTTSTRSASG